MQKIANEEEIKGIFALDLTLVCTFLHHICTE